MGLEIPLWRALTVFRVATLVYAVVLMIGDFRDFARPAGGWAVISVMSVWTALASLAYAAPRRRTWPLLVADLVVGAGCLLSSRWIVDPEGVALGSPTLPMAWAACPVLAWAISGGRRRGLIAALLMDAADIVVRNDVNAGTINGSVLMLLAGVSVGHVATLATDAETRLQRAIELEAATRERERLARGIHDSVLQVLALVQRRGTELGGEAADLGRLAGAQEATLRTLIATGYPVDAGGVQADLRGRLDRFAAEGLTIAVPATPVWLPGGVADELIAAVGSAVDNVKAHAGEQARAWLLLEEEDGVVTVTVRDNGSGFAEGRLAQAEAAGRLGVAQSIRGRIRDLGGSVSITSAPGRGTEVEMRVSRPDGSPE